MIIKGVSIDKQVHSIWGDVGAIAGERVAAGMTKDWHCFKVYVAC
jgi:hypothetical protein